MARAVGYYLPSLLDSAPFAPFVHLKLLLAAAADIILGRVNTN